MSEAPDLRRMLTDRLAATADLLGLVRADERLLAAAQDAAAFNGIPQVERLKDQDHHPRRKIG